MLSAKIDESIFMPERSATMSENEDLITGDFQLPTLPEVAVRILEVVKQDTYSFSDLGKIISSDPALTAKILKMANSSFYGLPQKVNTIEKAVSILGVMALKNIALSFVICKEFRKNGNSGFDFGYYWKRAVTTAIAADLICKTLSHDDDELFVTALLMDIGIIIMLMSRPEDYLNVLDEKRITGRPMEVIEKNTFGVDHQYVGSEVLKKWGLGHTVFEPVSRHHEIGIVSDEYETQISILAIAHQLSGAYHSPRKIGKLDAVKKKLANHYGLGEIEINRLIDAVAEKSIEIFSTFEIEPGNMKPYSEILQEANEELGRLVFSYEQLLMSFKEEKERAEALAHELKEKNEKLRNLSVRDGQTGLFNHKYFQEFLEKEIVRSEQYRQPVSLILLDLDHFKKINDTFGHRTGDIVLQKISELMLSMIRKNDIAARYGGEEFALILPETGLKNSLAIAERLRKAVERLEVSTENENLKVTISMGIASCFPGENRRTRTELIDAADAAMYHAKQTGRNKLGIAQ